MEDLSPSPGMNADQIAERVEAILDAASLEEKVAMMSGHGFFEAIVADNLRWGARPYRAGAGCETSPIQDH